MEDQDRTPEEEQDVEGHALRDPDALDPDAMKDDSDFEAHSLRDPDALDPDAMRKEEKDPDAL